MQAEWAVWESEKERFGDRTGVSGELADVTAVGNP